MTQRGKIARWVEENQGKHYCRCGCGLVIVITRNHWGNGIPAYVNGHNGRRRQRKNRALYPGDLESWIKEEQGNHVCHCGCGEIIVITKNHYSNGIPRYINGHQIRCRTYPEEEKRFWTKVSKRGDQQCWNWIASLDTEGYGNFKSKNKKANNKAHRMSYLLHFGDISKGLHVLHKCDNPRCVNPSHLFLGTHQDNMRDMVEKGRITTRKYTSDLVRRAAELFSLKRSVREVHNETGISLGCLYAIRNGRSWKSVTGIGKKDG